MRKIILIATALLLAGAMSAQASGHKPKEGGYLLDSELKDPVFSGAASHFGASGGDDVNAGSVGTATAHFKGFGTMAKHSDTEWDVAVSSSWDWGSFRGAEEGTDPELEVHRCALVNTTSHTFSDANDSIGGGFTTDASVTLTNLGGGTITGEIRGGSVCEIVNTTVDVEVPNTGGNGDRICNGVETCTGPIPCTVNEAVTNFGVTGGSGDDGTNDFSKAEGEGFIRSIFDFCAATVLAVWSDPDIGSAFVLNEIFLKVEFDDI